MVEGRYRKVVVMSEMFDRKYTEISIQRQGWVGRNVDSGATEVLPVNAFEIVPLDSLILPEIEHMIKEAVAEALLDLEPA